MFFIHSSNTVKEKVHTTCGTAPSKITFSVYLLYIIIHIATLAVPILLFSIFVQNLNYNIDFHQQS